MRKVGLVGTSTEDPSFYIITQKGIKYRNQFNSFASMIENDLREIHQLGKHPSEYIEDIKVKIRS